MSHIAAVMGLEHHYPIMNKLWVHGYQTNRQTDNNTPFPLLLRQYPESNVHNSDLHNLILCELDLTSTPFSDTKIITSNDELTPSVKKVGFNLLDYEDFTIT